ncbi:hypothetical protein [Reyranella sp. CPCC 100927]|uniref:hypothetical protein n=1 Tax=Reyranella sp. CPCC 100927 TaxID=2599616 RepID=UPI0011B4A4E1|nr:hypothetical protein [Reyranella sp. CPCC 100927]TWT10897.1 hypothetical protein FQU96_17525 [Reyranella sp. CPCC 100927]
MTVAATLPQAIDPLELYAAGIDTSDYVARVAPVVANLVPQIGNLLDIGAGGGQLGQALCQPENHWTAIEPSDAMRRRLTALARVPTILASGWETATPTSAGYDTVLAANIAAPLNDAQAFLARCRQWARRAIAWVVPAQAGPRGLCLAGCLPSAWHGEDETPGVDLVLKALGDHNAPDAIAKTTWTFTAIVNDIERLAAYLADRLGWPASDLRRSDMVAHLRQQARSTDRGYRLDVPRASAVLVWRQA